MDRELRSPHQSVAIGDRIVVRSGRQAMAGFVGKPGTVVAVFDAPRGSCVVRMDSGLDQPEVFVYPAEVIASSMR